MNMHIYLQYGTTKSNLARWYPDRPVQVHFPDLLGFYGYTQVHFTFSLPVLEKLSFPADCLCVFFYF